MENYDDGEDTDSIQVSDSKYSILNGVPCLPSATASGTGPSSSGPRAPWRAGHSSKPQCQRQQFNFSHPVSDVSTQGGATLKSNVFSTAYDRIIYNICLRHINLDLFWYFSKIPEFIKCVIQTYHDPFLKHCSSWLEGKDMCQCWHILSVNTVTFNSIAWC